MNFKVYTPQKRFFSVFKKEMKSAIKQSTIKSHFSASKGDGKILDKKSSIDDRSFQAESLHIPSKRSKTAHLQFSETQTVSFENSKEPLESSYLDDDVELSQCCTQPLPNQDSYFEEKNKDDTPAKPVTMIRDLQVSESAWLHQQTCLSSQV